MSALYELTLPSSHSPMVYNDIRVSFVGACWLLWLSHVPLTKAGLAAAAGGIVRLSQLQKGFVREDAAQAHCAVCRISQILSPGQ
eukprot:5395436-Pleurochrysis_carterae.AAC.1